MKNILVTYATMSGTTADVAQAVGEELTKKGAHVDVLPLSQAIKLTGYDAVVLGAPMIMGWHRDAAKFLKQNNKILGRVPLALFATAMSLTQTGETSMDGVPVFVDEHLAQPAQVEGKLSFKERYASIPGYVTPILKAAGQTKPVSVALFGGRLDIYRLKWWAALFVMLVIQAKPGEKRNWDAIRAWAGSLPVM